MGVHHFVQSKIDSSCKFKITPVDIKLFHVYIGDMNKETVRPYRMHKRARQTAQTAEAILQATIALWQERSLREITLEAIAERAGVTTRTVIRRFGSKEGVFDACVESDTAGIFQARDQAPVGDIEQALHILLANYEAHGDALIRTLAIEEELPAARKILERGRQYHRTWCQHVFAPYLPDPADTGYEDSLRSFLAATEFYLWKLLRRDLHCTLPETTETFIRLARGAAQQTQHSMSTEEAT